VTTPQLTVLFLLAWVGVVAGLVLPPLASFVLLFRKRFAIAFIVIGIYGTLIASFILYGRADPRNTAGRILRWCRGAGLNQQEIDDQVEDLRRSASLPGLQNWAIETMRRFRSGQVLTNGEASYWSLGTVQLAPSEISELVSKQWINLQRPEVSIKLSPDSEPVCIVVAWYLHGILLGAPGYRSLLSYPNYQKEATNGVYGYYLYK
jgi:hypothetical protein